MIGYLIFAQITQLHTVAKKSQNLHALIICRCISLETKKIEITDSACKLNFFQHLSCCHIDPLYQPLLPLHHFDPSLLFQLLSPTLHTHTTWVV